VLSVWSSTGVAPTCSPARTRSCMSDAATADAFCALDERAISADLESWEFGFDLMVDVLTRIYGTGFLLLRFYTWRRCGGGGGGSMFSAACPLRTTFRITTRLGTVHI
jgi:hypothetical protein